MRIAQSAKDEPQECASGKTQPSPPRRMDGDEDEEGDNRFDNEITHRALILINVGKNTSTLSMRNGI